MFPVGGTVPKCKESIIVDIVDDYVAFKELVQGDLKALEAAYMFLAIVLAEFILK